MHNSLSGSCLFRFCHDDVRMALIDAEELIGGSGTQQVLSGANCMPLRQPVVLHFQDPSAVTPVTFRFPFEVELLVVGLDGRVEKTGLAPRYRSGEALHVQYFSGYSCLILAHKGFCHNWRVVAGNTKVKRLRVSSIRDNIAC